MRRLAAVFLAIVAAVVGLAPPASAASWQAWENLGAISGSGKPAVAARSSSVVDVFAASPTNVQHRFWASGSGWSAWEALGSPAGSDQIIGNDVSAVARSGGRLSVVVTAAGLVWHKAYDGGWRTWENLGGPPSGPAFSPAVSTRPNGTVDVWTRAVNGNIYHQAWTGGAWPRTWENLGGGWTGPPAAAGGPDGTVWVAALNTNGFYYHRVWSPSAGWSGWYDTGTPPGGTPYFASPGLDVRPNGLIDLYAIAADTGPVYHRYRSTAGTWNGWGSLQGSGIVTGPNATGRPNGALDVVIRKSDGTVWHRAWA
ncbi:hypothetical protein [Paractinoplanes toevensis]|uniref:Carbohydrate-binding protein n=1 Tax=Paractinoplanes toevensis TaxID=571911 RepID=A0A920BQX1_9ACTN|nr:hypothetical protein [Actinoplanes toevensis]GIM97515.1 carbohydrate-binding protein [Actinoplanes toevensis]